MVCDLLLVTKMRKSQLNGEIILMNKNNCYLKKTTKSLNQQQTLLAIWNFPYIDLFKS